MVDLKTFQKLPFLIDSGRVFWLEEQFISKVFFKYAMFALHFNSKEFFV